VLQAQCATRQGQGPGARLTYGLTAQRSAGVGGQPSPIFTPARRPRRDMETNAGLRLQPKDWLDADHILAKLNRQTPQQWTTSERTFDANWAAHARLAIIDRPPNEFPNPSQRRHTMRRPSAYGHSRFAGHLSLAAHAADFTPALPLADDVHLDTVCPKDQFSQ
jgi:hypothetical protein